MSKKIDMKKRIVSKKSSSFSEKRNDISTLFQKEVINFKVCIDFNDMDQFVEGTLKSYAKRNIMGKCHKEGYISRSHCEIVMFTSGKMIKDKVYFDVDYEFMVCHPYEGMEVDCVIQNITKIGIKAVIKESGENPMVVFASRVHNEDIFANEIVEEGGNDEVSRNYKDGDKIKIKVIGYRFEINDPHLSVLGKILVKSN